MSYVEKSKHDIGCDDFQRFLQKMMNFQVPRTSVNPDLLTILSMAQVKGNVYYKNKADGTKNAANTEETSQTGVENRVNMRPPGNLVSKDKIGEANQTNKEQFHEEEFHLQQI